MWDKNDPYARSLWCTEPEHLRAEREQRRMKRFRLEDAIKALPRVADSLAKKPHPHILYASEGRTLLDYVNWCLGKGYLAGAEVVERELAGRPHPAFYRHPNATP